MKKKKQSNNIIHVTIRQHHLTRAKDNNRYQVRKRYCLTLFEYVFFLV